MLKITYMNDDEFEKICSAEGFKKNNITDAFQIINNNGIVVEGQPVKIRHKKYSKVVTYLYEDYWKSIEHYQLLTAQVFINEIKELSKALYE